jgi:hypothetical protein
LNSGDVLASDDVLQRVVAIVGTDVLRRSSIYYGDYLYCGLAMEQVIKTNVVDLVRTNSLNHQSMFIGADIMRRFPYDLRIRITMDYDVWLRCRSEGVRFIPLSMVVGKFFEGGISSNVDSLAYGMMSKEVCRFLNLYRKYTWCDLAIFFSRFSFQLFKARVKVLLGLGVLSVYRRIKFR